MAIYNDPSRFSNQNLNSVGSEYGATYGHETSKLIAKVTNDMIYNAQPQQFYDLALLNKFDVETVRSDEFFYQEAGYQREALVAAGTASAVSYPATQTIQLTSMEFAATQYVIAYPNNKKGTIIEVDKTNSTITVSPLVGDTLPAVAANDVFALVTTFDHDGSEGFASYFRMSTIERSNYIQMFNKAIKYGEMEIYKMRNAGTTKNFLSMETKTMLDIHRMETSNAFWIGQKAEGVTKNGTPAKLTGGVFTSMLEAGSANTIVTENTLVDGFEDIVMGSEYGSYGATRFAYMTPKVHRLLSMKYKQELTRYQPQDGQALLNLNEINLGSSRIVLVPYKRFEDRSSFPAAFENRIVVLDHANIQRCQTWAERSGNTLELKDGVPKRYGVVYIDSNFGVKFYNPLGCAYADIA